MTPLRITYVLPFGPPATHFGGPVAQLDIIAPALAAKGHDLKLVCTDLGIERHVPRDRWLDREGYRIHYSQTNPLNRVAPYWTPRLSQALDEAIADSDVVHLHLGLTLVNALARRIALRHRVPYVYAPRGSLCPHRLRDRRLGKWAFLRLFERRIIRDAAALHALTEKECDDLRAQGGRREKMRVIPNSVDMGDPAHWPDVMPSRAHFDIPDGAVAVLFLGQLHKIKGLDLLIGAVAEVHDRHRELMLLIAGPDAGYERQARLQVKQAALEQAVRFVGHLKGPEKLKAMRAADVFALTSYSEGLPNAVIEACHIGLPVLVTETCNVPEVGSEGAGYVVPAQRGRVAEALWGLVESSAHRAELGQRARDLAERQFSVPRVVEALEAMYRDLTNRKNG